MLGPMTDVAGLILPTGIRVVHSYRFYLLVDDIILCHAAYRDDEYYTCIVLDNNGDY